MLISGGYNDKGSMLGDMYAGVYVDGQFYWQVRRFGWVEEKVSMGLDVWYDQVAEALMFPT